MVDDATLEDARRGDGDALVVLWRTYQPQLMRFLRARRALAPEDVSSQVWIDVGRAIGRFEGDGVAFQRWIFTIARRRAIDEQRRVTRRSEVLVDDRPEAGDRTCRIDGVDEAASLEHALETVRRLPMAMAEAVMLRVVYDMSVTDVAQVMRRTEGNVRVLVHRGLGKLQEMLTVGDESSTVPSPAPDTSRVCEAGNTAGLTSVGRT